MQNKEDFTGKLTPMEKAKVGIFANRLGITLNEAVKLYGDLRFNFSKALDIPVSAITADLEVDGREIDMVFSMSKKSLPRK
jgi:hypothetical protein